jgi:hypothetical protein
MANESKADSNDTMKDMLENPIESQTFAQFLSKLDKYLADYLGKSGDLDVLTEQWDYNVLQYRSRGSSSGCIIKKYLDLDTVARRAGQILGVKEMRPNYIAGKHRRQKPNAQRRMLGKLYQLASCKWLSSLMKSWDFQKPRNWDEWFGTEVQGTDIPQFGTVSSSTDKRTASSLEDHESSDEALTRDGSSSITTTPSTAGTAVDIPAFETDLSTAAPPSKDVLETSNASALTKSTIEPPTTIPKASGRAKRTRRS